MRSGVPCGPGKTKSKGVSACLRDCLVELFLQVRKQRSLGGTKARRIACQGYRPVQFIVSQTADVVKIQCVGSIIGTGDVSVGPLCRLLQIVGGIRMRETRGANYFRPGEQSTTPPRPVPSRRAIPSRDRN